MHAILSFFKYTISNYLIFLEIFDAWGVFWGENIICLYTHAYVYIENVYIKNI